MAVGRVAEHTTVIWSTTRMDFANSFTSTYS